jgi:hypothetical protein
LSAQRGSTSLKRDPVWSNSAVEEVAATSNGLVRMVLHETLQDRLFVTALLDALPKCTTCGSHWVTRLAVFPVDLSEEEELLGLCDECPIPDGVLHVRILHHARALRELILRRKVWEPILR